MIFFVKEAKIFITTDKLNEWLENYKGKVEGKVLSFEWLDYPVNLEEAFLFSNLVAGDDSEKSMIGKVKTLSDIEKSGIEVFQNSAIIGENAYEVKEGFIISFEEKKVENFNEIYSPPQENTHLTPANSPKKEKSDEPEKPEDILAKFLIEKLK